MEKRAARAEKHLTVFGVEKRVAVRGEQRDLVVALRNQQGTPFSFSWNVEPGTWNALVEDQRPLNFSQAFCYGNGP